MQSDVDTGNMSETCEKEEFLEGAKDTFPLVVGAAPFGIIFGTLAGQAGMSFAATMGMSIFVFAGSAQFIAMGLFATGTAWPVIVMTTFVVNLRHLLYGTTMVPYYKSLSKIWQIILTFGLTDETFVVAIKRFQEKDRSGFKHYYNLGSMLFMYINWNICTFIGFTAGRHFPGISKWGLDFAMPATFIGMVFPYLKGRPMWACVLTSGAVSVFANGMPHKIGLILAAAAGIMAGMLCEAAHTKEKD